MTILIVIACVIGYLWVWRLAFRSEVIRLGNERNRMVDWGDVAFAAHIATLIACFFPAILVGLGVRRLVRDKDAAAFARRVGGESQTSKLARREQEAHQRELRILDAERELGIVQDAPLRAATAWGDEPY